MLLPAGKYVLAENQKAINLTEGLEFFANVNNQEQFFVPEYVGFICEIEP
jgi:hypothetical protein